MRINVYSALTILNGFNGSKWNEKQPNTMRAMDNPVRLKMDANIKQIAQMIRKNRRLSILADTELTGFDKESVSQILIMTHLT